MNLWYKAWIYFINLFNITLIKQYVTDPILQLQNNECGSICLAIMFRYFGVNIPVEILREDTNLSRDGTSIGNMSKVASKYGFVANGYSMVLDELTYIEHPLILHWEFNHFVILERVKENHFYINDPNYGHRKLCKTDFSQSFTGIVLEIRPQNQLVRHSKIIKKSRIKQYLQNFIIHQKKVVIIIGLFLIAFAIEPIFSSLISKLFVDYWILNNYHNIFSIIIIVTTLVACFNISTEYVFNRIINYYGFKILTINTIKFLKLLIDLPTKFYAVRGVGAIIARVHSLNIVTQFLLRVVGAISTNILILIVNSAALFFFDAVMGSIILLSSIIGICLRIMWYSKLQELYIKENNLRDNIIHKQLIFFKKLFIIKVHNYLNSVFERSLRDNINAYVNSLIKTKYVTKLELYITLLNNLTYILIFTVGGWQVTNNVLSVGGLFIIANIYMIIQTSIVNLLGSMDEVQSTNATITRILDVIDYNKYTKSKTTPKVNLDKIQNVTFDNISFSHNELLGKNLDNINFEINKGNFVSIVGTSGSGKTTLIKLLTRLINPTHGKIYINNQNIYDFTSSSFFGQIGYISQEADLYNSNLINNLTCFQPFNIKDVQEVMCILGIEYLFDRYSYKFNTDIVAELSGGEKQLIEFARVLLKNPSLLVLDEATSCLDALTEKKVLDIVTKYYDLTIINISHKLSIIARSDQVIMLEQGSIVENDSFTNLQRNKRSKFCNLFAQELNT